MLGLISRSELTGILDFEVLDYLSCIRCLKPLALSMGRMFAAAIPSFKID
jgi:hypothetical protein